MKRDRIKPHRHRKRYAVAHWAIAAAPLLLAYPGDAAAQTSPEERRSASPFHRMSDADGRTIPCVCSIAGRLVPIGSVACLNLPDGRQLARCELATNVTSWVPTGVECPVSRNQSPIPNPRT